MWIKDRFPAAGPITHTTAQLNLPSTANDRLVTTMITKLINDRAEVKAMVKEEIEELIRMGTHITEMTYHCRNLNARHICTTPNNMRQSYCQDGSLSNIKRMHFIFHQLPCETHQDILMNRQSHCDLTVSKVMRRLNIMWGPKREGETAAHTNCISHLYSRIMNEKKQNAVSPGSNNTHRCIPFVRNPKNLKGKTIYCWKNDNINIYQVSGCYNCLKHIGVFQQR